ncbi:hypothetical protein JOF41_006290 [Saccharothrix coeruleofusca]|uniref:DUF397 domain-containing protein n=1 Tax=Saccharothrix coeruleofusca TaxID=33919 RepID=UPI001AEAB35F|nr:DUF397 domain-containing protein [Saccharothrix coeruleofusca]MBP2340112.1 hypothetical protein [Saccharothrix coeruleofusca]
MVREPNWRKARTSNDNGQCVEVASSGEGLAIRDSKAPDAGVLGLGPHSRAALLSAIKAGRFDG